METPHPFRGQKKTKSNQTRQTGRQAGRQRRVGTHTTDTYTPSPRRNTYAVKTVSSSSSSSNHTRDDPPKKKEERHALPLSFAYFLHGTPKKTHHHVCMCFYLRPCVVAGEHTDPPPTTPHHKKENTHGTRKFETPTTTAGYLLYVVGSSSLNHNHFSTLAPAPPRPCRAGSKQVRGCCVFPVRGLSPRKTKQKNANRSAGQASSYISGSLYIGGLGGIFRLSAQEAGNHSLLPALRYLALCHHQKHTKRESLKNSRINKSKYNRDKLQGKTLLLVMYFLVASTTQRHATSARGALVVLPRFSHSSLSTPPIYLNPILSDPPPPPIPHTRAHNRQ